MTLSTTDNRKSYDGTGAQTIFPFNRLFYANADLQVTLVDDDGVETLQVLDTDYTVTGAGDANGGDVTMIVAPAATETLIILRIVENSQESDYITPGGMDLEVIEKDFDLSTMKAQQNTEELERAFRAPKGSPLTGAQLEIPDPAIAGNRSKVVATKADGTGLELITNVPVGSTPAVIDPGDAGKPMVANATEDGIEAEASPVLDTLNYSAETGAANAYIVTLSRAPAAYTAGMPISFLPTNVNTGVSTVNVNTLGVKTIIRPDGNGLHSGDLPASKAVHLIYDGTNFVLLNPAKPTFPKGHIHGLGLSQDTDTVHDLLVATGECRSDADDGDMILGTAITKQIDVDWAEGDDDGGFPSGLTLTLDTVYHYFVIGKSTDPTAVDAGWDTSLTAANLLSDASAYDLYRRIRSEKVDGSAEIRDFFQDGDYVSIDYYRDFTETPPNTTEQTKTLSRLPTGIRILADVVTALSGSAIFINTGGGDDTVALPTSSLYELDLTANANRVHQRGNLLTNTSAQVKYRSSAASDTIRMFIHGWIDIRGKDG